MASFDFWSVQNQITDTVKLLGWTQRELKAFIFLEYGRKNRFHLTDCQLEDLLENLLFLLPAKSIPCVSTSTIIKRRKRWRKHLK